MKNYKVSPTQKQAHLQTAQSRPANQSLQKSFLSLSPEKNKKISSPSQKLNQPTHNPEINNALTDKQLYLTENKPQLTTRGIVNKGFSGFRGAVTRSKISYNLTGKKLLIPY